VGGDTVKLRGATLVLWIVKKVNKYRGGGTWLAARRKSGNTKVAITRWGGSEIDERHFQRKMRKAWGASWERESMGDTLETED